MVWDSFSQNGKTSLFCFTNIINRFFYVNILQTQLLPAAKSMYKNDQHLQQDNDLKHISYVTKISLLKMKFV